jgi:hypothetical protein
MYPEIGLDDVMSAARQLIQLIKTGSALEQRIIAMKCIWQIWTFWLRNFMGEPDVIEPVLQQIDPTFAEILKELKTTIEVGYGVPTPIAPDFEDIEALIMLIIRLLRMLRT